MLIETFPFVIQNIHADNGSEYINQTVAKLLQKLLIELTKSRPRHSNDNALAECKNGAIVRKWLGYMCTSRSSLRRT
jgi:transposase InsO family protein